MQVFMPYPDVRRSVRCLDDKRLGNQVYRECKTLVNGGWSNHPVAKMWAPYPWLLCEYAIEGLRELRNVRGRNYPHHFEFFFTHQAMHEDRGSPPWLGNKEFHDSHKSNLLRKDPEWYGKFGWDVPHDLPYIYPEN